MATDKINELLYIALTTKEIQYAFKRYVGNLNMDVPVESLGILLVVYYSSSLDVIQQDIAEIIKKDKSVVLRQIDNLEKENLVQRIVDSNDKRRNIIKITNKGIKLINEVNAKLNEMYAFLTEGLDVSEMEIFYKVLNHLRNRAKIK
ncbi:MAG: MarR family transcriptional regulator [Prevotellaceae bacterium]|jgi:DNA-binding MarR family transcriptional regulator|nr:MarR family transcriptional regulator [Prevotellaceae bacterium]